ncbi:MAG: hypothetical protein RIK87_27720 [Fuerstiella sp.]
MFILVDDLGWSDLASDVSEQHNLAQERPETADQLRQQLTEALRSMNARFPE